jgi:hypothetical protein
MIDRTRSGRIHVINANASAGPDPGLDDFTLLVQNVTGFGRERNDAGDATILANLLLSKLLERVWLTQGPPSVVATV